MSIYVGALAAASNRVAWTYTVEITDPVTPDVAVDLIGSTIVMGIREPGQSLCKITGSRADGHAVLAAAGTFNVAFTAAEMKLLKAGTYEFGMTLKLANGTEHQLLAATLPVIDGVVDP